MNDYGYLNKITSPSFVKNLNEKQTEELCGEIRDVLVNTVSHNGGHLASNLGVVELTVALHKMFDSPRDQIVWDVGHQTYTHKLLTGRYAEFSSLRTEGGISGFSRPSESEHDIFYSGHSSTSVSAAVGLSAANRLKNDDRFVVCVLGDGSFTGGMIYEAMNNACRRDGRLIVILNENEMSISQNVGAVAKYLAVIRSKPRYFRMKAYTEKLITHIPFFGKRLASSIFRIKTIAKNSIYNSNLFEDLGFRYMGPVDGHNIGQLCDALYSAKLVDKPVLLHVYTTKGKGYDPAERSPSRFHGVSEFDIDTGEPVTCGNSFSGQFGKYMCELAEKDSRLCAISAAMSIGTGLAEFERRFGNRFFDVGIAEEHAVTFASGLSKNGMKPVFAVYSSFLQRAYDQLLHDGALQRQKLVIAIDRAGFVGTDGETHQGIYDVAFMDSIPDIKIYSPSGYEELKYDLTNVVENENNITAIRYPRGEEMTMPEDYDIPAGEFGIYGNKTAETSIVTYGRISTCACAAVNELKKFGIDAKVIKLNMIKPLPEGAAEAAMGCKNVFFFEEGVRSGGVGERLALTLLENGFTGKYKLTAVNDCFVAQATVESQLKKYRLDTEGMTDTVREGLL